jgi:hypothetical protein
MTAGIAIQTNALSTVFEVKHIKNPLHDSGNKRDHSKDAYDNPGKVSQFYVGQIRFED